MNDKISIIIATRNRWGLLVDRAITSILNQTHQNWELIVVDDGSDTNGHEELNGVQDERIGVYRIEKTYPYPRDDKKAEWLAGPCLALNEALKYVTGDWIYRCDDDDILRPDCLESLLRFAKGGDFDFVSALWEGKDGLVGMPYYDFHTDRGFVLCEVLGGVQTWLYKVKYKDIEYDPYCWKKHWNQVNDLDWTERFLTSTPNLKIGFLPKIVVTILPRPGNMTVGSKAYILENRWDSEEKPSPE